MSNSGVPFTVITHKEIRTGDTDTPGSIKVLESFSVLQNPCKSEEVVVVRETITEEQICSNKRYRFYREVITPYIEPGNYSCDKEALVEKAIASASCSFPETSASFTPISIIAAEGQEPKKPRRIYSVKPVDPCKPGSSPIVVCPDSLCSTLHDTIVYKYKPSAVNLTEKPPSNPPCNPCVPPPPPYPCPSQLPTNRLNAIINKYGDMGIESKPESPCSPCPRNVSYDDPKPKCQRKPPPTPPPPPPPTVSVAPPPGKPAKQPCPGGGPLPDYPCPPPATESARPPCPPPAAESGRPPCPPSGPPPYRPPCPHSGHSPCPPSGPPSPPSRPPCPPLGGSRHDIPCGRKSSPPVFRRPCPVEAPIPSPTRGSAPTYCELKDKARPYINVDAHEDTVCTIMAAAQDVGQKAICKLAITTKAVSQNETVQAAFNKTEELLGQVHHFVRSTSESLAKTVCNTCGPGVEEKRGQRTPPPPPPPPPPKEIQSCKPKRVSHHFGGYLNREDYTKDLGGRLRTLGYPWEVSSPYDVPTPRAEETLKIGYEEDSEDRTPKSGSWFPLQPCEGPKLELGEGSSSFTNADREKETEGSKLDSWLNNIRQAFTLTPFSEWGSPLKLDMEYSVNKEIEDSMMYLQWKLNQDSTPNMFQNDNEYKLEPVVNTSDDVSNIEPKTTDIRLQESDMYEHLDAFINSALRDESKDVDSYMKIMPDAPCEQKKIEYGQSDAQIISTEDIPCASITQNEVFIPIITDKSAESKSEAKLRDQTKVFENPNVFKNPIVGFSENEIVSAGIDDTYTGKIFSAIKDTFSSLLYEDAVTKRIVFNKDGTEEEYTNKP